MPPGAGACVWLLLKHWYRHHVRQRRTLPAPRWGSRPSPLPRSSPWVGAYALPICHAASDRDAGVPRGAGFQPAWRHTLHHRQVLTVAAGAQARISCNITVYAQESHTCLTDSLIGKSTSSTSVTRIGNSMPRAGSRARLARQHSCRTPNDTTRTSCARVRQPIRHVLARLERRTVTGPVAQNNTHSDHTR